MKTDVLIIGPGGLKGYLALGYLDAMYKNELKNFNNIKYYCGISIGSIISLFLIMKYNPRKICDKFNKFNILKNIKLDNIYNFVNKKGICSLNDIKESLKSEIMKKYGTNLTLMGLYNLTKKNLITVTYNLTKQKGEFLDKNNNPNMKCVDAIINSISVPFLFENCYYNNNIYIDGAFFNSYPVEYFNDDYHKITLISLLDDIKNNSEQNNIDFMDYINRILNTLTIQNINYDNENVNHIILKTDLKNIIGLPISNIEKGLLFGQGFNHYGNKITIENKKFKYDNDDEIYKKIKNNVIYPHFT